MSNTSEPAPVKAVVVGASRGLGRGIADALRDGGTEVVALARDGFVEEVADARDRRVAMDVLERHRPDLLVIAAGAVPEIRPLHEHTWETFAVNFDADVKIAFEWARAALVMPMTPGSRIIVISSGAALRGSQLSGGYAGAKATQRFIATYAKSESDRLGLDLIFTTVLPRITPHAEVGRVAVEAYAERAGQTVQQYLATQGVAPLTPALTGAAIVQLARTARGELADEYILTADGVTRLG
jgi:NAD(P)-dependent dehydrogenase (short-subunit alcohol dehydrogenase family)